MSSFLDREKNENEIFPLLNFQIVYIDDIGILDRQNRKRPGKRLRVKSQSKCRGVDWLKTVKLVIAIVF